MWPTELTDDPGFVELTPLAQWLFRLLWLHPDLDSGGFIALQVEVWAKASAYLTPQEVEGMLDELIARGLVSVDDGTGELWVRPFVYWDASRKPNIFVAAMRATQTRRSKALRAEAWVEIDRLYRQNTLKPPDDDTDEKAWKFHRSQVKARDDAYEELKARVERERFPNRSGTVREPPSVGVPVGVGVSPARARASVCEKCGRHPAVKGGLCGACRGRELAR
jgi:hypothetical protein